MQTPQTHSTLLASHIFPVLLLKLKLRRCLAGRHVTLLHVQLEAVLDDEAAGADEADVLPLPGVDAQVRLEVRRLQERLAAVLAAERPHARVDSHVHVQVLRRGVRLAADAAREALAAVAAVARGRLSRPLLPVGGVARRFSRFSRLVLSGGRARHADQFDPERVVVLVEVGDGHGIFGQVSPHRF